MTNDLVSSSFENQNEADSSVAAHNAPASSQTADKYAPLPDPIVKAKTVFLIRVEFYSQS
jgi:hypothetical protein